MDFFKEIIEKVIKMCNETQEKPMNDDINGLTLYLQIN